MFNEESKKGGRGQCKYCYEWHNNVSYHEAHECVTAPHWLNERMEAIKKLPAPTLDEVELQLKSSDILKKLIDRISDLNEDLSESDIDNLILHNAVAILEGHSHEENLDRIAQIQAARIARTIDCEFLKEVENYMDDIKQRSHKVPYE